MVLSFLSLVLSLSCFELFLFVAFSESIVVSFPLPGSDVFLFLFGLSVCFFFLRPRIHFKILKTNSGSFSFFFNSAPRNPVLHFKNEFRIVFYFFNSAPTNPFQNFKNEFRIVLFFPQKNILKTNSGSFFFLLILRLQIHLKILKTNSGTFFIYSAPTNPF